MSTKDFRSDIDMWIDMWREAEAGDVHPKPEAPKAEPFAGTGKAQDFYYGHLDSPEELLQEFRTPNPVYPDSVGPDPEAPKPRWADENLLKEVERLKNRLFEVENRMARLDQGKKWTSEPKVHGANDTLMSEIDSLRKRLEVVSSRLGIAGEPSPWEVKRD